MADPESQELERDGGALGTRAPAGAAQEDGSGAISVTKETVFPVSLTFCRHTLERHGLLELSGAQLVPTSR